MTKTRIATAKPKKRPTRAARLPRPDRHHKTVARLEWQGIAVSVSYEPNWSRVTAASDAATAHLEIRAVSPEQTPLPVTDTGYRSHFLPRGIVENAGGAVAYAKAWLDDAAKSPAWKKREQQSRQLCLF
jgi:hypothetical protein